eukprot:jgi/Tetstr1/438236/TSEL_002888.t1
MASLVASVQILPGAPRAGALAGRRLPRAAATLRCASPSPATPARRTTTARSDPPPCRVIRSQLVQWLLSQHVASRVEAAIPRAPLPLFALSADMAANFDSQLSPLLGLD